MNEKSPLRSGFERTVATLTLGATLLTGAGLATADVMGIDKLVTHTNITPDLPLAPNHPVFDITAAQPR